jgi:hypothetical protein
MHVIALQKQPPWIAIFIHVCQSFRPEFQTLENVSRIKIRPLLPDFRSCANGAGKCSQSEAMASFQANILAHWLRSFLTSRLPI